MDADRNPQLVAAIAASGLSYAALASHIRRIAAEDGTVVRTNSAAVAHWVRGSSPKATTAAYLAEALSRTLGRPVTTSELGLGSANSDVLPEPSGDAAQDLADVGRMDVNRRGFITAAFSLPALAAASAPQPQRAAAARRGGMVGRAEVEAVREITSAFLRADERLGGGVGRSAMAEYLATDATTYLRARFADSGVRKDMFGAVAELARAAGFKAHDAGRPGLAQRYYRHALELARESDPRGHAAFVLRLMAHQAIDLGHGRHCVEMAEGALDSAKGRVDGATRGQLHLAVARTRAVSGEAAGARTALEEARRSIEAHPEGAPRPWWSRAMGDPQALLATHTGKTLAAVGDPAAVGHLERSARRWDAATHPRVRALTLCDLGELQARRGHVESACGAYGQALDLLAGVDSGRARSAVATMRSALRPFARRGGTEATRLEARAARWQGAGKAV